MARAKTKREQARVVYVRRVPPELVDQLDALARAEGATRQDVALRALAAGAEALERAHGEAEAHPIELGRVCEVCNLVHGLPLPPAQVSVIEAHAGGLADVNGSRVNVQRQRDGRVVCLACKLVGA